MKSWFRSTPSASQMVRGQLAARGIRDERLLSVMERIPRDRFVPDTYRGWAYADQALPIDCEQTISQPYMVALMTELLQLDGTQRVLEIGTGSGYQTAVLAELCREVYTIERHAALSEAAQQTLCELHITNVQFRVGDGSLGWPEEAPFERILITAAAPDCPPALWEQLAEGGILCGPFGSTYEQILEVWHKRNGESQRVLSTACRFVPLIAGEPPAP